MKEKNLIKLKKKQLIDKYKVCKSTKQHYINKYTDLRADMIIVKKQLERISSNIQFVKSGYPNKGSGTIKYYNGGKTNYQNSNGGNSNGKTKN